MRKDRRAGLLCAILSLSVFLSCLPRVARAEETEIPCYSVTEGLSYEVSVSESSSWDTHANIAYVLSEIQHQVQDTFPALPESGVVSGVVRIQ